MSCHVMSCHVNMNMTFIKFTTYNSFLTISRSKPNITSNVK